MAQVFVFGFLTSSILFLIIISIILIELSSDRDVRNLIIKKRHDRERIKKLKLEEKQDEVQA